MSYEMRARALHNVRARRVISLLRSLFLFEDGGDSGGGLPTGYRYAVAPIYVETRKRLDNNNIISASTRWRTDRRRRRDIRTRSSRFGDTL